MLIEQFIEFELREAGLPDRTCTMKYDLMNRRFLKSSLKFCDVPTFSKNLLNLI